MPAIKGVILPDYFPQNKATMTVFGIPTPFTILQISGLEDELDTAELLTVPTDRVGVKSK